MNTQPNRDNALPHGELAAREQLRERAFWQSRSNLRDAPELVDLHRLAREVRRGQ